MLLIIALLSISSVGLLSMVLIPVAEDKRVQWQDKQEQTIGRQLDDMFSYEKTPREIVRLYYILPFVVGTLSYLFLAKSPIVAVIGAVVGFSIPSIILKIRDSRRRQKFNGQILDSIMILSSCLKGGLSLLQSFEVLVEETPAPMSQEIGLVVRENKMGITLEESLRRLSKRMNIEELNLVVNSILVARETGGDLTKVFSRLCTTIRDNMKLKENIKTLTLQGRLQGIIMSVLPFIFVAWVVHTNKQHFEIMFNSELGRTLLIIAVVLQIVGIFLIRKFSIIKI
ncbi:MAG: type II secretion system F family protein [Candidatus Omnitrophica bacterium]|nr:type II secretion system F family protein [Candidatus Omnitrophota bacterium]